MRAKKFFGQHFLRDTAVIGKIVAAAEVDGMAVLEIGSGEGVVTAELAKVAERVIAIDIDEEAIETTRRLELPNVELVCDDVLHPSDGTDVRSRFVNTDFVLVGNLPYNITSDLLRWMLASDPKPARAVVMVQEEVGERVLAGAGDLSLLGLMVQVYAKPTMVTRVPRGAFAPPPKVDSMVVRLDLYRDQDVTARDIDDPEKLLRFARVGFNSKRKQLASTLGTLPKLSPAIVKAALHSVGRPETARPQELSTDDWVEFYRSLHQH